MMKKPILAVFCILLCLSPFFFFTPAIGVTDNSLPSTFHVTFQRSMKFVDGSLISVSFLDGTYRYLDTASFTFSMEKSTNGEYTVKFMLALSDGFSEEVSLPATVSEGRVYIDSTPTIFVVNPSSLIEGNTIQLWQKETLSLSGTVKTDSWPETSIEDYYVSSTRVEGVYQQTGSSNSLLGAPFLFFDSKTGVLTGISPRVEDVLLNKVGVASISGGNFVLSDYSENLNFTLDNPYAPFQKHSQSFFWWLILVPVFVISFGLIVFFVYRRSFLKKKNGEKQKTYSNEILKFNFISNIKVRYAYGL